MSKKPETTKPCPAELRRLAALKKEAPNRLYGAALNEEGEAC